MKKTAVENLVQIGGEAVCIKSDLSLPEKVIDTLSHVIEVMFRHAGTALNRHRLKGKVIRLNETDMASIQTRFQYNDDERGYVFNVYIYLNKATRMVRHHLIKVTNELVKATFVLKSPASMAT